MGGQKSYKNMKTLAKVINKQEQHKNHTLQLLSKISSCRDKMSFEQYNIEKYFQYDLRYCI